MRRRELLAAIGATAIADRSAVAQQAAKVVGILAPGPLRPIASFKQRLSELGWVEGRNVRFEDRWAEGDDGRYVALAAELAALSVDAVMTWSTPAVMAAKRATAKIPVIMAGIADPVAVGAVASLARPGGNVTGFSTQNFELEEKRFELLRELVPGLSRVAMLGNASNPYVALANITAYEHIGNMISREDCMRISGKPRRISRKPSAQLAREFWLQISCRCSQRVSRQFDHWFRYAVPLGGLP